MHTTRSFIMIILHLAVLAFKFNPVQTHFAFRNVISVNFHEGNAVQNSSVDIIKQTFE